MKKTAAILILGLFLFNWLGYRVLTSLLQAHADTRLELQLDNNNYNESDLISLKIPANLPYYANSRSYERMDGQIEIDGIHYNYVKRRFYNDSLEYLCIPNKSKIRLNNAQNEFFKLVNDIQQPSQKKSGDNSIVKNLLSEYYQNENGWSLATYLPDGAIKYPHYLALLCTPACDPQELPPDFGC